jgi:hypothetical protein
VKSALTGITALCLKNCPRQEKLFLILIGKGLAEAILSIMAD